MRGDKHPSSMARRWLGLVCALGTMGVLGCAYDSQYVAPNDGRARAVWKEDNVVVELAGAPVSDACLEQLRAWSDNGTLRLSSGDVKRDVALPPRLAIEVSRPFWIPVYFGP